ncbi:MAG: chemotaxis sensory transducer [Ramlibacter sp.]|nr:chemotaxis sensory transducer [Ramlibacter sp.]
MGRLRIVVQLRLAFGLLLMLMLTAVAVAFLGIRSSEEQAGRLERENVALLNAATAMRHAQLTEAVAIRDFVGQENVDRQRAANETLQASEKAYAEAVATLEKLASASGGDGDLRAMVDKLKNASAPVSAKLRDAMQLSDAAEYPQAQAVVYNELRPLQAAIAADLQLVVARSNALARDRLEAGHLAARTSEQRLLAVALIALVIGVLAAVRISRAVTRPLGAAVEAAERVASGDLTAMNLEHRGDETGRLLAALGSMQSRLNTLVAGIRGSADAVNAASERISASNGELAARTEEQASSLEQTAASVEELTAIVKQNSDNAAQASELAQRASGLAGNSGEAVGSVVRTMERIQKSSRKVSDIVGVMDEIAFQTNLLALNAAVEAARAGEHGRGFAVVAAQVRVLAQRSAEASKDIKKLATEAVADANQGAKEASRAGDSMSEVVRFAHELAQLVTGIARASEEQRAGIEQVNTTLGQMDGVTQSNAALVQEISGLTDSLLAQAQQLVRAASRFRLEQAEQRATAPVEQQRRPPPPAQARRPATDPHDEVEDVESRPVPLEHEGFAWNGGTGR